MKTRIIVPPSGEPVTIAEAKAHAYIDADLIGDDAMVASMLEAAREVVEGATDRALVSRTVETVFRLPFEFPDLRLPLAPVLEVASVWGVYADGEEVECEPSYFIAETGTPGLVKPRGSWFGFDAVKVQYRAGYGEASDVPESAKLAIKVLVSHWHQHRLPIKAGTFHELPFTVKALLGRLRWGNYPR